VTRTSDWSVIHNFTCALRLVPFPNQLDWFLGHTHRLAGSRHESQNTHLQKGTMSADNSEEKLVLTYTSSARNLRKRRPSSPPHDAQVVTSHLNFSLGKATSNHHESVYRVFDTFTTSVQCDLSSARVQPRIPVGEDRKSHDVGLPLKS
jgi:hypothetical protein